MATHIYASLDENSIKSLNILSSDSNGIEIRIQAAKYIKNCIIGNKLKKKLFIDAGAIPLFVNILNKETDEDLLIQASSIIGSFGCRIDEGSQKIFEYNGVTPLISLLSSKNLKLVESAARSLKIVSLFHQPPPSIYDEQGVKLLISLFNHPLDSVKEVAATIIARGCESLFNQSSLDNMEPQPIEPNLINHSLLKYQNFVHIHSGLSTMISILVSPRSKIQEACLYAIGWLTRDNVQLSSYVVNDERKPLECIVNLFKKNKSPRVKLLAVNCLCNFNQSKILSTSFSHLIKNILPIIIRLMAEEETVKEEAPVVLARLIVDNEDFQRIASEAEAITRLGSFLKDSSASDRLKENSLTAIAVLCSQREDSRKQVVDAKIIPQIISSLNSSNYAIRAAACNCTKSLSRSIKQLRTSLFDCTIATPLLKLLDDPSLEVRVSASATLCNLVLDFSPMKQAVLDNGILQKLVQLIFEPHDFKIRLNCIWALKNLLYMAEPSLKESAMKELGYDKLIDLIKDHDSSISEQALAVLRNLAFKDNDQLVSEERFNGQMVPTLESKLTPSNPPEIIKQTLFVICNIVTNEKIRNSVMNSSIVNKLLHFMEHKHSDIRVVSIWCVCNLIGPDENTNSSVRAMKFKELGYVKKLESLVDDQNIEVKDRVKTALNLFKR
ncbi:hypothetical protein DICPUDRAFT_149720 [Dictyostelium purpureum]|uniref:Uncharacterized protein n=1 Tax=Dictyostelium purpureum TaxID=5786 RepID=F0ZEH7_DICPU|nr:uncharacterized protein DICPUDRAFT_149720 [Dictyostelium purpureum]EGC37648.1 hypothetical protein DICPUDRAFT_149720 [Dictyostelium purpureum]|eukprot:XP_003285836.1 hypothetical protein DICPUDRAFT_149720 [Dictyostelium purpureum]